MRSLVLLFFVFCTSCTSNVRFHSGISNGYIEKSDYISESSSSADIDSFTGVSSYYADKFHGQKTASGEIFNMYKYTCAHRTLPFGTKLLVTNLANNESVEVTVNDRGPFAHGRVIDLSRAAAEKIDLVKTGTANVKCEVVK